MNKSDTAWVAGILEGEGCFTLRPYSLAITCSMTDEDVVRRLHTLATIGTVIVRPRQREHWKTQWVWRAYTRREVVTLIRQLRPWMGLRRAAKIDEMLRYHQEHPVQRQEKGRVAHGTRARYDKWNCRCRPCTDAERDYKRQLRRRD